MKNNPTSILKVAKLKLREILEAKCLLDEQVSVTANLLTPEEAIGSPNRRDFPIIEGKERVIEAKVLGAKGHAFTDSPQDFRGTLRDILEIPLDSNQNRAIFVSSLNATLRHLGEVEGTVHCKDEDPEKCAKEIADYMIKKWGKVTVGIIGLNPAIAENLAATFGSENVLITDLNTQNINKRKFNVLVQDGRKVNDDLIMQSDVILITGTTIVNDTFDKIYVKIKESQKEYIIYGVTCAGVSHLMNLNRICPYSRN